MFYIIGVWHLIGKLYRKYLTSYFDTKLLFLGSTHSHIFFFKFTSSYRYHHHHSSLYVILYQFQQALFFRGFCTCYPKLVSFVLNFKIINTVLKNNTYTVCILFVQGTQKWHWNFSRPGSFKVMDQNSQMLFGSMTQKQHGLP